MQRTADQGYGSPGTRQHPAEITSHGARAHHRHPRPALLLHHDFSSFHRAELGHPRGSSRDFGQRAGRNRQNSQSQLRNCCSSRIPVSRAMRSAIGGCVENRLPMLIPNIGFTMNR